VSTLVVFDSTYGNTEIVARAIAEVLALRSPVRTLRPEQFQPGHLEGVTLLVVGSPGRSPRPSPGILSWLAKLQLGSLQDVRVAAFDTRLDVSGGRRPVAALLGRWFGYPAARIERRLLLAGGDLAAPAQGFVLEGPLGPPREGETDRARAWARAFATG